MSAKPTVSIDGIQGELSLDSLESAADLALTLMLQGYSVRISHKPVGIFYGPGVDYVVWKDSENQVVNNEPVVIW